MGQVTFYSLAPGLICWAGKTRMDSVDGTLQAITPPCVRFQPVEKGANGKQFGMYQTEDPDIIEYLTARMKTNQDVISAEQFARFIVPAETRATQLEETVRELQEQNRLLKQIKEQEAVQEPRVLPKPKV